MTDHFRIDSHKLDLHPQRVAQWLGADTWEKAAKVYPIYWEVTTSAACSHRCTFCSVDAIGYPAILMDAEVLIARMGEAASLGVRSVMFAGTGEPLLHKKIDSIVAGAVGAGLDVAFTTNGVLLDRLESLPLCSWVKVSVNAGRAETYAAVHKAPGQHWYKVWTAIERASRRKGSCTLGVQCVVLPENVGEMDELAARAKDAGCDYLVLKPYSQGTFSLTHEYEALRYEQWDLALRAVRDKHTDEHFSVIYRENAMRQESESHHYDQCRATPTFWTYSMADGRMFTCSAHLMDERFCIGNLNAQSFQAIWEGEKRRENWELMRSFDIKQCRLNCRQNLQNRYLHDLKVGVPHANFI